MSEIEIKSVTKQQTPDGKLFDSVIEAANYLKAKDKIAVYADTFIAEYNNESKYRGSVDSTWARMFLMRWEIFCLNTSPLQPSLYKGGEFEEMSATSDKPIG